MTAKAKGSRKSEVGSRRASVVLDVKRTVTREGGNVTITALWRDPKIRVKALVWLDARAGEKPDVERNVLLGWREDGDFARGYWEDEEGYWRDAETCLRFSPQPDMWAEVTVPQLEGAGR